MKTPASTEVKTSALDQRDCMDPQGELFDGFAESPSWPTPGTLDAIALEMLLTGATLTSPEFQASTQSWRLAACVERLRHEHRWPVVTVEVVAPTRQRPKRVIGQYHLRPDARATVRVCRPRPANATGAAHELA